jgi:hypothetical protein
VKWTPTERRAVRGGTRWAKVRHSRTVKRTPTEGREESCEGLNTTGKVRHSHSVKRTEGREENCEGRNTTGKGQTLTYCEEDADGGGGSCEGLNTAGKGQTLTRCEEDSGRRRRARRRAVRGGTRQARSDTHIL